MPAAQSTSAPSDSAPSESSDHGSILKCGLELGTASLLVLFLELVLIRWLPTQVQVVSYFPNLVLIAAFLGLGIGAAAPHSVVSQKFASHRE